MPKNGLFRTAGGSVSANLIQIVRTSTTASFSIGTTIPFDNTIPQITEGSQVITLAITPTNASNRLYLDAVVSGYMLSGSGFNAGGAFTIFQDTNVNAISSTLGGNALPATAGAVYHTKITYNMLAGTTSATTFQIRAGVTSPGDFCYINRETAALYGGSLVLTFTITEVKV